MSSNFQETLEALKNLETPKSPTAKTAKTKITPHNIAAALREAPENSQTPKRQAAKTAKITNRHKTEAEHLGLIATWSHEFGYISIHDPTTGEWHDLPTKDAPDWAKQEAFKRKDLYRAGNRCAYSLTAQEMEELWEEEHLLEDETGIVEEHPLEEEEV